MARVDFPLECSFELNRHYYEYTITIVQVRERYTDVRILKKERKKERGDVGKHVIFYVLS